MKSVRRTWDLSAILGLLPDVHQCPSFVLRCKRTVTGEGQYVKDLGGIVHTAVIALQVTPDETLSVSLGHEWPAAVTGDKLAELDQAVFRGIIESLARRCALATWGCGVTTISAMDGEGTGPLAVQIAAAMAVEDMLQRAEWSSPEPPTEGRAA